MKFYGIYRILVFLFISWTALSCATTQQTSSPKRMNLNFLYNPNAQNLHAQVIAHNKDLNTTRVYCQIPSKDLMFLPNGESSSCNLNIRYTVYETTPGLKLMDTMSFIRSICHD